MGELDRLLLILLPSLSLKPLLISQVLCSISLQLSLQSLVLYCIPWVDCRVAALGEVYFIRFL